MTIPQQLLDLCHTESFALHLIPMQTDPSFLLALVHTETGHRTVFNADEKGFAEAIEWLQN
jgi:hypothetical protein